MDRDRYKRDLSDANYVARRTAPSLFFWTVVAIVMVVVVVVGLWWAGVLFSGPKGAGEQTKITNDGRNRVNSQEWFEGQYQQIVSADRRIDEAWAQLKADPKDEIAKANFYGLKNRCIEMVGNYNAEARKVTRGQWMAPDLPLEITPDLDPRTDCKETVK